ncbi:DUF1851 domain-containing protein [Betaproteobacteria bacterium GR16-43]|nr:DUF1851 domain-containing protein [Betaproteobacteria bacterium GR16-43]
MSVVELVKESWGWTGIDPVEVVAINSFGNLLIKDQAAQYWRLCPEDLYCRVVATNDSELASLLQDPEFAEDWEMRKLVKAAHDKLGPLKDGERYCLKLPAPVGGAYEPGNLATLPIDQLLGFCGYVAEQIKDLPDGAPINFTFPQ